MFTENMLNKGPLLFLFVCVGMFVFVHGAYHQFPRGILFLMGVNRKGKYSPNPITMVHCPHECLPDILASYEAPTLLEVIVSMSDMPGEQHKMFGTSHVVCPRLNM